MLAAEYLFGTTTRIELLSKDATCGPGDEAAKKFRNFHASNWLLSQTTHVYVGP